MGDQDGNRSVDWNPDAEEGIVGALARALKGFRPLCEDSGESETFHGPVLWPQITIPT